MSAAEMRARAVVERLPKGKIIGVEVGVYDGRMSEWMLRLQRNLWLYMIDNWRAGSEQAASYRETDDPRSRLTAEEQEIAIRRARKATEFAASRRCIVREDSVLAAESMVYLSLDFAFIDADHSYEGVTADIAAWLGRVRAGGVLCGHDYGPDFPGVLNAVDDAAAAWGWEVQVGADSTWFVRLS